MAVCRLGGRRAEPRAAAFEVVYVEHEAVVYGYLARRLDSATAEEAVAEVFATAWAEFARRGHDHDVLAWLLGLSVAAVGRRRPREVRHLHHLAGDTASTSAGCRHVARALAGLDPVDRDLLTLHVWAGVSHQCAGALMGVPAATARTRIDRAYDFVRRHAEAA